MSTTQNIVSAPKYTHSLQLWFSGQRAFGDFLVEWCSIEKGLRSLAVRILAPPVPYVAILPDEMMAVQELHMTREEAVSKAIWRCANWYGTIPEPAQSIRKCDILCTAC